MGTPACGSQSVHVRWSPLKPASFPEPEVRTRNAKNELGPKALAGVENPGGTPPAKIRSSDASCGRHGQRIAARRLERRLDAAALAVGDASPERAARPADFLLFRTADPSVDADAENRLDPPRLQQGQKPPEPAKPPDLCRRHGQIDLDVGDARRVPGRRDVPPEGDLRPSSCRRGTGPPWSSTPRARGRFAPRCAPGLREAGTPGSSWPCPGWAGPDQRKPTAGALAPGNRSASIAARQSLGTTSKPTAGIRLTPAATARSYARPRPRSRRSRR